MEDIRELEIRQKIYDLIKKNPGLHARKIAEILCLQGQLADYHLQYLEKTEMLSSVKEEGYRRYYVKGTLGVQERKLLSILRRETPLRIVVFLLQHPGCVYHEMPAQLHIDKSTLTYHLKKISQYGILRIQEDSDDRHYFLENEQQIIDLLVKYKPYTRMERFKDTWVNLNWPRRQRQGSVEKEK